MISSGSRKQRSECSRSGPAQDSSKEDYRVLRNARTSSDGKRHLRSLAILLVLLAGLLPFSGDVRSENPGIHDVDYPLKTFKFFRRTIIANRDPSVDVDFDSRMIRFSAVVTYLGEYRPLSDSKKEKFEILNTVNVLHEKIWFFNYEVKIRIGRAHV